MPIDSFRALNDAVPVLTGSAAPASAKERAFWGCIQMHQKDVQTDSNSHVLRGAGLEALPLLPLRSLCTACAHACMLRATFAVHLQLPCCLCTTFAMFPRCMYCLCKPLYTLCRTFAQPLQCRGCFALHVNSLCATCAAHLHGICATVA